MDFHLGCLQMLNLPQAWSQNQTLSAAIIKVDIILLKRWDTGVLILMSIFSTPVVILISDSLRHIGARQFLQVNFKMDTLGSCFCETQWCRLSTSLSSSLALC